MRVKLTMYNGSVKSFPIETLTHYEVMSGTVWVTETKPSWCPGETITVKHPLLHSAKELLTLIHKAKQPSALRKRKPKRLVKV